MTVSPGIPGRQDPAYRPSLVRFIHSGEPQHMIQLAGLLLLPAIAWSVELLLQRPRQALSFSDGPASIG
jgi:hypothetical protein